MDTQKIKTWLIHTFGETPVAFLQAIRFAVYISKRDPDPEVSLLPSLISGGDTVVDIGANGANWTYWLHRQIGNGGTLFAFEADPYYALATDLAVKMMRLRGVRFFRFGLSDVDEQAPLVVAGADGLRMSGLAHIDRNAKATDGHRIVALKRLDSLIEDHPKLAGVNLIKCDVEGYELFVFRGAQKVIASSRPLVILEVGHYETQGYSARDVHAFFAERDYQAFALIGGQALARTDQALERADALSVNRVMIPSEKIAKLGERIRFVD